MLNAKILAYKKSQRYAVRRTLLAACDELRKSQPDIAITITEVKELAEIEKYTLVVILPSLLLNEHLVCVGRFPSKDEVIQWLQAARRLV